MDSQNQVAAIEPMVAALEVATDPAEVVDIEAKVAAIEGYMRQTGLYSTEEIRPVNEARILARWRLGQLLAEVEKRVGRPEKSSIGVTVSFTQMLRDLGTSKQTAMLAQRLGTLPRDELNKSFAQARENDVLSTIDALIVRARPFWYQENRKKKHRNIAAKAEAQAAPALLGPFPLIYADPPWRFEIYSEMGAERTPDQHYPTLSLDEIIAFEIDGRRVSEIAHKDAALFLWCTSSNLDQALKVMAAWGFTFKTSAAWDKGVTGLGLVFRNQHELLLYGTRGAMPGPQYQPPSLFRYPRGEHSAKPPEIRAEIEKMYPDFTEATRLEMFTRSHNAGWTGHGFESDYQASE